MGQDSNAIDAIVEKKCLPVCLVLGSGRLASKRESIDSVKGEYKRRHHLPMMYKMYESQYEDLRGTVCGPDSPDFHPAQVSEKLRLALRSMDNKDQVIVSTLLSHNNFQRQKILSAYEDMYGRASCQKLTSDLEEETGGYFLEMSLALLKPAHQYDAMNLHRSISNRHGDHSVAIEIACTRSARQLRVIQDAYVTDYKKTLDMDILVKVEGAIGRMLTMLLCKPREEEGKVVDSELVNSHAELLVKLYFAEQLHDAMMGERPDHQTIIRITVSRSEIDLYDIGEEYNRKYQRTLIQDIQKICSGDYMRLAVKLLSSSSNNDNHIN
ncbi:hypothetical protein KIN20_000987 [Parelaphostrongylus tenuis]|uniref:Annexin n=1 Tax=Parelaphostrongylus tenuis TaxID=148309 RepID=A0AAD5LVH5_PARTN|nr:hypothetical protein KIN20_000987 [Parelaphostrongylus tenuis]